MLRLGLTKNSSTTSLFITHILPASLIVLETLCFEQLKLKVCILIIFICLSLRKYSVNAHCDLNMITSCPKGRTASIGHHSWHPFPRIRKPKPMSSYFFHWKRDLKVLSFGVKLVSYMFSHISSSSSVFRCMEINSLGPVVQSSVAVASTGNLLETHNLRPFPRPTEQSFWVRPRNLFFSKSSRDSDAHSSLKNTAPEP